MKIKSVKILGISTLMFPMRSARMFLRFSLLITNFLRLIASPGTVSSGTASTWRRGSWLDWREMDCSAEFRAEKFIISLMSRMVLEKSIYG